MDIVYNHRNSKWAYGGDKMLSSIEAERVRHGLTKEELAKKLNVATKTYYNWIREETDVPSSALLKMSTMFNVSIDYLLIGSTGVKEEPDRR